MPSTTPDRYRPRVRRSPSVLGSVQPGHRKTCELERVCRGIRAAEVGAVVSNGVRRSPTIEDETGAKPGNDLLTTSEFRHFFHTHYIYIHNRARTSNDRGLWIRSRQNEHLLGESDTRSKYDACGGDWEGSFVRLKGNREWLTGEVRRILRMGRNGGDHGRGSRRN